MAPRPLWWATVHALGVRGGREIVFDLATVSGIGIDGAGAAAAIRAEDPATRTGVVTGMVWATGQQSPAVCSAATGMRMAVAIATVDPSGLAVMPSLPGTAIRFTSCPESRSATETNPDLPG